MSEISYKPGYRFRRTFTLGLALLFVIQNLIIHSPKITESRKYRDIFMLTPFTDVVVHTVDILPSGAEILGELRKRRCTFDTQGEGLIAYVLFHDAPKRRTIVNTDVEENFSGVNVDRPPSSDVELWGPWVIKYASDQPTPDNWEVYAGHWCPIINNATGKPFIHTVTGKPILKFERNLFAQGSWKTLGE